MSWESFTQGLADRLATLRPGDIMVVSRPAIGGLGHHARFAQHPERLVAEFVSVPATSDMPVEGWAPGMREGFWRMEQAWPVSPLELRRTAQRAIAALRAAWGELQHDDLRCRTLNEDLRLDGATGFAGDLEWESFTQALAAELAELPAGALVVISERDGARFAQFAHDSHRIYAEVSGDQHLPEGQRLSPDVERVLAEAGWQPCPGYGNRWAELAWPASSRQYRELAARVVTALRDGHGIVQPDLHYSAWNERAENEPLDLPRLDLPREPAR